MTTTEWTLDPDEYATARELAARAPAPARVRNVTVGTAGWTDKSLLAGGLFYPRWASAPQQRLEFYASQFAMVEVDSTYYSLLPRATAEKWVSWTSHDFRFNVKAHPIFTGHRIDAVRLPADLREAVAPLAGPRGFVGAWKLPAELRADIEARFCDFVEPLARAGRLSRVMLQFPPWFDATRGNARRIEALAERMALPLSVEFRHPSWLEGDRRARVMSLLSELHIAYVVVDEPDAPTGGVPPAVAVTAPQLALLRLHGRNAAHWKPGSSVAQRFNYLYSEPQLAAWVPRVREMASRAESVHVVFNNCVRDFAVLNAKGLATLLLAAEQRPMEERGELGGAVLPEPLDE